MPGFSIADAGEGLPLPLHPIPDNADLHSADETALLCKSHLAISSG
jgi:hypothetical protein